MIKYVNTEIWNELQYCGSMSKYLYLWLKTNCVCNNIIGYVRIPTNIALVYTGLQVADINNAIIELQQKGLIVADGNEILISNAYKDYTSSPTFIKKIKKELVNVKSEMIKAIILSWIDVLEKKLEQRFFDSKLVSILYNLFDGRCAYCGCTLTSENFTVDHKKPLIQGGENSLENFFPSCRHCNSQKQGRTIEEYREEFFNTKYKFFFER